MYDFGGSLINKIYFINVGTIRTNGVKSIYSGDELAIIFENTNGQGLIFRFIDCGRGRDYLTFSVLSQENMGCIKSGCSHFISTYFSVDRHYRYSLSDHALDQTNEGDQSVIITNIQKGNWSYRTSYKCYFSLDISNDQYQNILNDYLLDYDMETATIDPIPEGSGNEPNNPDNAFDIMNFISFIANKIGVTSDQLLMIAGGSLAVLVLMIIIIVAIRRRRY